MKKISQNRKGNNAKCNISFQNISLMNRIISAILGLLFLTSCSGNKEINSVENRINHEKTAGDVIESRIDSLVSVMTLREKTGQLCQMWGWESYARQDSDIVLKEDFKKLIRENYIGSTYGIYRADPWTKISPKDGPSPEEGVRIMNKIQKYNMENTRLKIPLLFSESTEHGRLGKYGMVYPTGLLVGCTFDPELAEQMYGAIAKEALAAGTRIVSSPILDLAIDPRWGRVEETFGEDPYLAGLFGEVYTRAFQGERIDENSVLVTLKHFLHGTPEGGHNTGTVSAGERELRSKYLKPFKMAVKKGAVSVMCSYNTLDGIPCTMNPWLLTGLLRDEWGFNGIVISDAGSVSELDTKHRISGDSEELTKLSVEAGLDVEMGAAVFMDNIIKAVESKKLDMDYVDLAVERVLRLKFKLGLFDHPYIDESGAGKYTDDPEFRKINRQVAREGIVLLENKKNILPLDKNPGSVAVIGPNADKISNQLGSYVFMYQRRQDVATVLTGIKNAVSADTKIYYARGCAVRDPDRSGFKEALDAVAKSNMVVMVLGGSSGSDFEDIQFDEKTGRMVSSFATLSELDCGEGFDKSDLGLSGVQKDLFDEVVKTGKPVIVVYITGRPVSEPEISEKANAVLEAWYCGWEGGNAVADILFGDYNPSGKLCVSVPRNAGQVPVFYNNLSEPRRDYVDLPSAPLYPFGYGLSYTSFKFSNLAIPEYFTKNEDIPVSVDIENTGDRDGTAVLQVYVQDEYASVATPVKEIKAFKKVFLKKGEKKTITASIPHDELAIVGNDMKWVVEPGKFKIMIGESSENIILSKETTLR